MSPTVAQALAQAQAAGLERFEAHWLLAHLLQRDRSWLLTHGDDPLPPALAQAYTAGCARRAQGEPLAYVIGHQEFHGLRLQVTPDVLVPRPDTETLVDWALQCLPALGAAPQVIDLGTGSGAVALALAHRYPAASVWATDLSPAALAVAQANARALGLPVQFRPGAWWQAAPAGQRFDMAVSNPPYIAGDDPHLPALAHEPLMALTPGGDGLDAVRALIQGAPEHLRPGGWLLLEHGWDQGPAVRQLFEQAGWQQVCTRQDIAQRDRCTGACWPGPV